MKAIDTWHQLVTTKNLSLLDEILSDDVIFYSPIVNTPLIGKKITKLYLTAALVVFGNKTFKYVCEIKNENNAALEFTVDIDGIMVNGVDMISWDSKGKITAFKVMVRPLKAIHLIHQKMAVMLESKK